MNRLNKTHLAGLIFSLAVGRAALLLAAPPPVPPAVTPSPAQGIGSLTTDPNSKSVPDYMSYTYYGERYRDPFIPLNGDLHATDAMDHAPQIASLVLKGIVQDANGRMALLTSGVNSYILRSGRLYDGRNRPVKKITGVIKTDSVIVLGADRTVRELKTKTEL